MDESEVGLARRMVAAVAVGLAVTALAVLAIACTLVFPADIVGRDAASLTTAERLKAENDVRGTLLQALAGLVALSGVGVGAALTFRQLRVSREGQTIDLFTKAIEHLSSDRISVRHGGVYALEQIAGTAPRYRGHVAALLTAFVRQHAPWPPVRPIAEVEAERRRYTGGLADDVGAALAALSRGSMVLKGATMELEKVDLRGAELANCRLARFCFIGSNLEAAKLTHADLSGCDLAGVDLSHADLRWARLVEADLSGADLTGARLDGADLAGIRVSDATVWPDAFSPRDVTVLDHRTETV